MKKKIIEIDLGNGLKPEDREGSNKLKDQGNGSFKAGDFGEAVRLYGLALDAFKLNTTALANRAAAHLKLNDFHAARADAQTAVAILNEAAAEDATASKLKVKCLFRGAKANVALCKGSNVDPRQRSVYVAEAREWLKLALASDPKNKDAATELTALTELEQHGWSAPSAAAAGDGNVGASPPKEGCSSSTPPPVAVVRPPYVARKPVSSFEFEQQWRNECTCEDDKVGLLKLVPWSEPTFFATGLDQELFEQALPILVNCLNSELELVCLVVRSLVELPRFKMSLMFLDETATAHIETILRKTDLFKELGSKYSL